LCPGSEIHLALPVWVAILAIESVRGIIFQEGAFCIAGFGEMGVQNS
jgi:hypothetical protein